MTKINALKCESLACSAFLIATVMKIQIPETQPVSLTWKRAPRTMNNHVDHGTHSQPLGVTDRNSNMETDQKRVLSCSFEKCSKMKKVYRLRSKDRLCGYVSFAFASISQ